MYFKLIEPIYYCPYCGIKIDELNIEKSEHKYVRKINNIILVCPKTSNFSYCPFCGDAITIEEKTNNHEIKIETTILKLKCKKTVRNADFEV